MSLPKEWANESLVLRIEADPGAFAALSQFAQVERDALAASECSGLLIEHETIGVQECTLSAECPGGSARHDVRITCGIFDSCPLCTH